jgi:hypothetical protein
MDKKLKFILILFPVILVSAYFYSISIYAIDPLDVLANNIPTCPPQCAGVTEFFIISCPDGFNEITSPTGTPPSSENTACVRDSANESTEVVLHCGDEYVEQGMVETVECSTVIP